MISNLSDHMLALCHFSYQKTSTHLFEIIFEGIELVCFSNLEGLKMIKEGTHTRLEYFLYDEPQV